MVLLYVPGATVTCGVSCLDRQLQQADGVVDGMWIQYFIAAEAKPASPQGSDEGPSPGCKCTELHVMSRVHHYVGR